MRLLGKRLLRCKRAEGAGEVQNYDEFIELLRNDEDFCEYAYLLRIFLIRYRNTIECPECGKEFNYGFIPTRKSYHCRYCYNQLYALSETPFKKSRTPLTVIVSIMRELSQRQYTAKYFERKYSITYKTAYYVKKKANIFIKSLTRKELEFLLRPIDYQDFDVVTEKRAREILN